MNNVIVSPSILSADFTEMKSAIAEIKSSGAQWVHCDVMDGVFVPNISFGQKMVGDIRKITDLVLDVHLMIVNPEKYIEEFAKNGADYITIHYEATERVEEALKLIKQCGCKVGLALKPGTDVAVVEKYLDLVDMVLLMSVEPGFSGQKFKPETIDKMKTFTQMAKGKNILLQGDGGINMENAATLVECGCTCLVAGNAFFKAENKAEVVKKLKGIQ
ncbi:MAG: ribulose-phosphate 3-epimerase [Clostridia bacterium]|nr:ribulose-phosphate 3-epimerase [Clostridia bacterium]